MEEFFKWQLRTHGKLGSHECEGWGGPREWPHSGIPTMVRAFFNRDDETSTVAPDGVRWPTPTPLLLGPGDAAISTFEMPHAGSRNELGPQRQQIIFRFQREELGKGAPGNAQFHGPDEEAEVMDGIREQLTDCWRGWEGMASVAAAERPATEGLRAELQAWFDEHGAEVTWT